MAEPMPRIILTLHPLIFEKPLERPKKKTKNENTI